MSSEPMDEAPAELGPSRPAPNAEERRFLIALEMAEGSWTFKRASALKRKWQLSPEQFNADVERADRLICVTSSSRTRMRDATVLRLYQISRANAPDRVAASKALLRCLRVEKGQLDQSEKLSEEEHRRELIDYLRNPPESFLGEFREAMRNAPKEIMARYQGAIAPDGHEAEKERR